MASLPPPWGGSLEWGALARRGRGWFRGGVLRALCAFLPLRFPPHLAAQVESVCLAVSHTGQPWQPPDSLEGLCLWPREPGLGTPPPLVSASFGRARSPVQAGFFKSVLPHEY